MKNYIYGRSPLLVCAGVFALMFSARIYAQPSNGFSSYLQQLPGAPKSPADGELVSASASAVENSSDINKLEKQLTEYFAALQGPASARSGDENNEETAAVQSTTAIAVSTRSTKNAVVNPADKNIPKGHNTPQSGQPMSPYDSCRSLIHEIQGIANRYTILLADVESKYVGDVNAVDAKARAEQTNEPCGANSECLRRHRRNRDLGIVSAEHTRIDHSSELVNSEIKELLPVIKKFDLMLPKRLATVTPLATRRELDGLSSYVMNIVLGAAEHIKLSRIHIAECVRLLQESR
ncbi:MAG TPA: hypothetical protein VEW28_10155 [Candidatus Kapabacteria bacterium]|nr:hypothetical protein [Candidatus Kapabacteria bacterium]